jgi:plasmid stabilization system protein ParE
VIALSSKADAQLYDLTLYYEEKDRLEAARNLAAALDTVKARIMRAAGAGLDAPRPYPELKALGLKWMIEENYWFAYTLTVPPVIAGIFHASADIPRRV